MSLTDYTSYPSAASGASDARVPIGMVTPGAIAVPSGGDGSRLAALTVMVTAPASSATPGTFAPVLQLAGPGDVSLLVFSPYSTGSTTVRLKVDGVLLWTTTVSNGYCLFIVGTPAGPGFGAPLTFRSSLLLEASSTEAVVTGARTQHNLRRY